MLHSLFLKPCQFLFKQNLKKGAEENICLEYQGQLTLQCSLPGVICIQVGLLVLGTMQQKG